MRSSLTLIAGLGLLFLLDNNFWLGVCLHVGRGSDDKSSQPTLAEKASYDYRHQDRKGILDDIICVNDCPGGVSSVRAPDFGEDQVRDHRAVRSVLPNWEAWRDRGRLPLFFRMMQILAAHGIFVEYLQRIGREVTNICHHCGEGEDTAQHTLEFCPAWEVPRRIPMASHWREIRPLVSCEANGKTRVSRSSSILRRRNARKATNKVGERENILPLQGSCAALGGYRGRHAEEDLDLLRLARRPKG